MARKHKEVSKVENFEETAEGQVPDGTPDATVAIVPDGSAELKKGYYVVRGDRTIVVNPKNGTPLRFSTKVQADTFAGCVGNAVVLIVSNTIFWFE